ncbi:restriction endonuclease subunit S [Turicibacter bilis]|uniref:Restriction endonuclease subunit S n=1 Tax=Turicibacter bilis TaxID=2735723 RepID=A0ABY5JGE3_9FIRM|nr:restriction endonuclease subunit S [Turicibacter bilis]MBS3201173.1 restriction endonuclease subunit S [Turicibacter bilis]UUF05655.1 restriction endonuclease subunit S [Turicibacter bilis]
MNNFKNIKISDLPLHISDGNYSSKYPRADEMVSHGVPFIRANNLKNGTVIWEDMKYISSEKHEELQKGHLEEGDVLITVRGDIGKLSIVPRDFIDANINAQIALLRVYDRSKLDNKFLFYSLNTPNVIKQFNEKQTGTALKQLPIKSLREVSVLIPAIKEQQKIADILSSVDAVIEKTEQVIAKTEEVKKGLMQQLLTKGIGHTEFKQTEIGEIPIAWSVKRIKDLVSFSGGAQPPRKEFVFEPREGYIRLIQIRDYKNDKYATYIPKELAKKLCDATDIMIGRYGPPIFQILRGIEGAYNVALIKAIPDEIYLNKDYLYYFLQRQDLFNLIDHLSQRSSGQTGIDMEALNNFGFPLPQLEEQMEIVKIIRNIENKIHTEKIKYSKLNAVKTGLMQHLLTGKTRVKVD